MGYLLDQNYGAGQRDRRRSDQAASGWRHDPHLEQQSRLLAEDPAQYERTFGAHGRIAVGLYQQGKAAAAAAGLDTNERSQA